jgi:hypothetical protein
VSKLIATALALFLAYRAGAAVAVMNPYCVYCHERLGTLSTRERFDHWRSCVNHPATREVSALTEQNQHLRMQIDHERMKQNLANPVDIGRKPN